MMMRQLAAVGETYAQTALEDTSWSLWPMNPSSQASTSTSPVVAPAAAGTTTVRYPPGSASGGLRMRTTTPRAANDLLAMAETVREVLPHIPDELIFQVSFDQVYKLYGFSPFCIHQSILKSNLKLKYLTRGCFEFFLSFFLGVGLLGWFGPTIFLPLFLPFNSRNGGKKAYVTWNQLPSEFLYCCLIRGAPT